MTELVMPRPRKSEGRSKDAETGVIRFRVATKAFTEGLGCTVAFSSSYEPASKSRRGDLRSDWKAVGDSIRRAIESVK